MTRQFKFDVGDWVAIQGQRGWRLAGKVVDADSDSCIVENAKGVRSQYLPGEDAISRVRWTGRGQWKIGS